jgi:hypothetical protein
MMWQPSQAQTRDPQKVKLCAKRLMGASACRKRISMRNL